MSHVPCPLRLARVTGTKEVLGTVLATSLALTSVIASRLLAIGVLAAVALGGP